MTWLPIMIGGMGVDISSADLALEAARLGGVGHISDAMIKTVTDRRYKTKYVKAKQAMYKYVPKTDDKSNVKFNLEHLAEATRLHVEGTMKRKQGPVIIFINCMEKLTMNAPQGNAQGAHARRAGCRHRRHHTGRRFAPGFVCAH
jgi:nitronate monooxygenase